MRSGEWCAFGADGEMPRDQRPDDGGSLTFDTDPLEARLEVVGAPVLEIDVQVDKPVAMLAVRLNDVAPDGSVLRVSYGLLNLTHRNGHERPDAIVPGQWMRVRVQLNDLAHAFPPGHRMRISLSTSYWPIAWPAPHAVIMGVRTGTGALTLPVRRRDGDEPEIAPFGPPEAAPSSTHKKFRRMPMRRTIEIDLTSGEMVYTLRGDGGEFDGASLARIEEIDLDLGYSQTKRYRILENDPLSAQTEMVQSARLRRKDWSVRVECRTHMTATRDTFQFTGEVDAFLSGEPFANRTWTLAIPRALV